MTFHVTSVTGHVFSVDFPPRIRIGRVLNSELFGVPLCEANSWLHGEISERCGKNVDSLVLWLDCDREGKTFVSKLLIA